MKNFQELTDKIRLKNLTHYEQKKMGRPFKKLIILKVVPSFFRFDQKKMGRTQIKDEKMQGRPIDCQ